MGEILKFKRPSPAEKHKGKTLCKSGFHRWEVQKEQPFDVKLGRLVTLYRCARCGATRTEAK
ncbi:hypothetical protein [Sulfurivermis fontis]|jgi:hypothetical protein|uniref:hypothetical protein n=1 Tax=Sulfurivermis fontis TaxID=1972068 RepID=UPI000FD99E98